MIFEKKLKLNVKKGISNLEKNLSERGGEIQATWIFIPRLLLLKMIQLQAKVNPNPKWGNWHPRQENLKQPKMGQKSHLRVIDVNGLSIVQQS
jgi:hypothetical protein